MIYAPILNSTQAAFLADTDTYPIYFTLPSYVSLGDFQHIQVYIVKQSNNASIADITKYPDGIIYKDAPTTGGPIYKVEINKNNDLKEPWEVGAIYKIQLRLGKNAKFTDISSFASWKHDQVQELEAFSEWSTVMIIKAIQEPKITVAYESEIGDNSTIWNIENTRPLFTGTYSSNPANHESLNQFQFVLYNNSNEEIETSGWLSGNLQYRFKTILQIGERYKVKLKVETVNGYIGESDDLIFNIVENTNPILKNTELYGLASDQRFGQENAAVRLYISTDQTGIFVISRSDETSNFTIWEDLTYIENSTNILTNPIYIDYTIESGVAYKYAIAKEASNGIRTSPLENKIYATEEARLNNEAPQVNNTFCYFFEYNYLYRDGLQLRLQYDSKVNSFKHTVLRSKQDTLGDKYPHLVSNGYAYYAEFPLTGLITLHMDQDSTFFNWDSQKGLMCKDTLIAPVRMFQELSGSRNLAALDSTISTDLINENVYIERKVREKIESWLNDFTYKLYKSPTEGNIVIGLMNISLTPKQELGRMIYEFSATAYELAENNLDTLKSLNIINDQREDALAGQMVTESIFGQITGIYAAGEDIYAQISFAQNITTSTYTSTLNNVTSFWIDQYPTSENARKEATSAELKAALANTQKADSSTTVLTVNGNDIVVLPQRMYTLNSEITSLKLKSTDYPIIVNYLGTVNKEYTSVIYTNEETVVGTAIKDCWGQLAGIFSTEEDTLKYYDTAYLLSETERIFNPLNNVEEKPWIRRVVDTTNYNVYRSVDILQILKQETLNLEMYKKGIIGKDDNGNYVDNNGTAYRFSFEKLNDFQIEGDPGSELLINNDVIKIGYVKDKDALPIKYMGAILNEDDEGRQLNISYYTATDYKKFKTNNQQELFDSVEFKKLQSAQPQFLIVDYKCQIRIETLRS